MLQRIQTLYLIIVLTISVGLTHWCHLWVTAEGTRVFAKDNPLYLTLFISSGILSTIAIIKFKKRKLQFILGRLNIISNFILLVFFVYQSLKLSGETAVSEKGIGMLLPVVSIVLLALANKAIKKDEELVKSVDRLR